MGGIDADVERIFLGLSPQKLGNVLLHYGELYGKSAHDYAKSVYEKWRCGTVRMSGMVAERLLNMVPIILEPSERFDLVKKLRSKHLKKEYRFVTCTPSEWRETIGPVVNELVQASSQFQLPQHVVDRANWLANGDSVAAQKLLAAAEKDEAQLSCQYLAEEYRRIEYMLENMPGSQSVKHTIKLPQGTVAVTIALPRTGFIPWLKKALAIK